MGSSHHLLLTKKIRKKHRRTKDEALILLKEKIRQVAELLKKAQRIMEE